MRAIKTAEKRKRGCEYCADMKKAYVKGQGGIRTTCPYAECPYKVLDKYDSYDDYMKSKDSRINITALFEPEWGTGRVTPCGRVSLPVLRRLGKEPTF